MEAVDTSSKAYPELNFGTGAKWVKHLTQGRLDTLQGGHFSDVNLSAHMFLDRTDASEYVKLQVWSAPGLTKPSFHEAMKQSFRPTGKGESFGPSWSNHWFKVSLTIPKSWSNYERIQFEFDPGCEAMIYDTNGTPLQGITGGYGGDRRVEYIISSELRKKGTFNIVIESSSNGMFGVPLHGDAIDPPDPNRYFQLASADLAAPNQDAWGLMFDFNTLRQIINNLPGNSPLQNKALVVANKIMNTFRHDDPSTIKKSRKLVEEVLGQGWEAKGDKVYAEGSEKVRVWGIGHCHIDTAWLWPYSVTQQKVARSWSTQVDLMERYPEYHFTASSAQQWKWLEQLYPALFDRVKEKVMSGQFHPVGGSWVENDANMPSGEALARQLIFGQRFFISRFGNEKGRCDTAWLPDSFGLSGALPQLIRGAGMNNFFTQKLSWNNINSFPHSTFNWVGIDGTQVLCHMTPVETYTAQATLDDVRRGVNNHKNLESSDTSLLVFGNGDGGGGPLAGMLESLRRIRAVGNESRDIPLVTMGSHVDEFFHQIEKETNIGETLPNWHGELYLEFHRGTYTSHASIKRGNRKSEILLREVELVATLASLQSSSYVFPKQDVDALWENLLLNQFHDVLPGSAIGMVYEDAERIYTHIAKKGRHLIEDALKVLLPSSFPVIPQVELPSKISKGKIFALNTVHAPRREVVKVPFPLGGGTAGFARLLKDDIVQVSKDGQSGFVIVDDEYGASVSPVSGMFADSTGARAFKDTNGSFVIKNANVSMTIHGGRIVSLYDVKLGRELISKGKTGGLVIFDDRPNYWDAWDVEIHHLETRRPLEFTSIKVIDDGPVWATLEACLKYGQSTITVNISVSSLPATHLEDSRSYFKFDANVDWRQRHEFLKFDIPLDIHSQTATFDAAFGNISRPTHRNTSQELAKFEVCGHKYADLSEYGYGVAILSESKYGFAAAGNLLSISLLRSPTAPDPEQDQGRHEFSWALLPHASHFYNSDVPLAAYLFNSPVHVRYAQQAQPQVASLSRGLFSLENAPNVILETVKRGDDDNFSSKDKQSIVLRLYEAYGGHAQAKLRVSSKIEISKAVYTNLLEEELGVLDLRTDETLGDRADDTLLDLDFRGFQVVTVKLIVKPKSLQSTTRLDGWIDVPKV